MSASTPPKKRTKARPAPAATPVPGEPVGQWAKVLADGQDIPGLAIEPFAITEGLVLQPLTSRRARALGAAQNAYLVGMATMANAQRLGSSPEAVTAIQAMIDEGLQKYNEALFGEAEYPRVAEYFADQESWKQELFVEAVKRQFLRLPDDDGACQLCGHVEGSEAERIKALQAALAELDKDHPLLSEPVGKGSESSTTSSTTGPSSSETSQPSSAA
ncbi:MAG: hypothetical protein K2Y33_09325 [Mycolicibacterium frederiksbergense]|nr:hypothetical protein [Mycolicibacterium frederiksbergense]